MLVLDILDWLREGKPFDEILENFPTITREDIQAILARAKDIMADEEIIQSNGMLNSAPAGVDNGSGYHVPGMQWQARNTRNRTSKCPA